MNLICINCPRGCHLTVEKVNDEIVVNGNMCPRGVSYATSELVNPLRTLTTTIDIESESYTRLPVISSKPLPRERVMDAMRCLKETKAKAPVNRGDVIVENILDLGVDIIASKTIDK